MALRLTVYPTHYHIQLQCGTPGPVSLAPCVTVSGSQVCCRVLGRRGSSPACLFCVQCLRTGGSFVNNPLRVTPVSLGLAFGWRCSFRILFGFPARHSLRCTLASSIGLFIMRQTPLEQVSGDLDPALLKCKPGEQITLPSCISVPGSQVRYST